MGGLTEGSPPCVRNGSAGRWHWLLRVSAATETTVPGEPGRCWRRRSGGSGVLGLGGPGPWTGRLPCGAVGRGPACGPWPAWAVTWLTAVPGMGYVPAVYLGHTSRSPRARRSPITYAAMRKPVAW
jgi:hypothetical protein